MEKSHKLVIKFISLENIDIQLNHIASILNINKDEIYTHKMEAVDDFKRYLLVKINKIHNITKVVNYLTYDKSIEFVNVIDN